ncbi:hypothetical protein SAY87_015827 [Trapa incisa]|uniref:non-specific serine/threonine protein kinase n=1 Tax=Trapa incisa TaxID=236973 RepID=A0AAN7LFL4_9MYRT|nr:hypothetical protein SAY87_015827 [Trapa incisa]
MKSMKEKSMLLCLVVFLCFCTSSVLGLSKNLFQVQALLGIKASLQDPNSALENWDENYVDPCLWSTITCSDDGYIKIIQMPSLNLSGELSPSIINLTTLEQLFIQNNSISGQIPAELGKLSKLQKLDLSQNSFTGGVPAELSNLKDLQILRLNDNNLSGPIPLSFADMTLLTFLDLSYNNFSPPLPKLQAKTFKVVGNPLICTSGQEDCYKTTQLSIPLNSSNSQYTENSGSRKRHRLGLVLGLSIGSICIIAFGFGLFVWRRHRLSQQVFFDVNGQYKEQHSGEICLGNLKKFNFRELQMATNNFSSKNLIGKGGSGNVYKGYLRDKTVVAVKRLRDVDAIGGEVQFQTEVEMISLAVHRHLLRLYGFCMTATERLLVYPYMANGSVASRLKGKPTLEWGTRKRIAVGAARGLLYLHEQCDPKIIHRDVKAANILLDEYYEAVVGDFGLAKLLDHRESHVTTAVRGTAGHIAPEYLSTGQSSEKTDVFGFGILLLELISGQKTIEPGKAGNQRGAMLDWVRKLQQEKKLEMLVDKDLKGMYSLLELEEMVRVALLCTQYHPSLRPKMSEVVRMLEGDELAERWEASQRPQAATSSRTTHDFFFSDRCSDLTDDSSLLVQEMELSGPR